MKGRELFEAVAAAMGPPRGIALRADDADRVPVEWATAETSDDAVVLYLHGGGFSMGSIATGRHNLAPLLRASRMTGLNVGYRLAPEHPFPAAVDDVVTAYRWLTERVSPNRVVILGESAGGGLALSLLLRLRDDGVEMPAGCVTISPWADLCLCGDSYTTIGRRDLSLSRDGLALAAALYLREADPRQPTASPAHAELDGLPPLLLLASTQEIVLDDTRSVIVAARRAGVPADVILAPRMLHCWPGYGDRIPRAERDV